MQGHTGGADGAEQLRTPLTRQLSGAPADDRLRLMLDAVLAETAELLGLPASSVDPERPYIDYGYNSLAAVELTNQLSDSTGLDLPLTMLFDQPTPAAVAGYLLARFDFPVDGQPAVDGSTERGTSAPRPVQNSPRETAESATPTAAVPGLATSPAAGSAGDDPIAVVGMACRLPGGVSSPAELWQVLIEGRDVIGDFPDDRGWQLDELYHPDPDHPGTAYARTGGFVDGATEFDAEFFGISPREALAMDPQQRLLLETVWETFEDAGIDPAALRGSQTGVFAGISGNDYSQLARAGGDSTQGYWGLGTLPAVASGRVAYTFGLEGPALTVDTACSSSLVATHLAMRALRSGECTLALAGGSTVSATPSVYTEFSRQRALSPDGRCRSFAASADGTGFSDGVAVLLLERLSDARRNGHHIHALLRGSAINQDGASNGMTAPHGPAQERVIHAALTDAGLTPTDIDAIEAHGTATTLGDPIEAQALINTYGQRPTNNPLHLGTLKSNIGHTQAAAGVGGIIKMIMALHHHTLPATLHIDTPTPKVDWHTANITLLTTNQPWPTTTHPRRAGISSFGASGTNAHLIIEEPPTEDSTNLDQTATGTGAPQLLTLSAKSPSALGAQARRLHEWITGHPDLQLADLAYSLATTRAQLNHRATVIAATREELLTALATLGAGELPVSPIRPRPGRLAFVFPGQGSQWQGMAVQLLESEPVFAERLRDCGRALAPYVDFDLIEVLRGEPAGPAAASLERVDVVQPVLFAVMVSLAALWRSYGIEPDAVVGHSQGEIAAACVAGALSLADAARIVALRSAQLARMGGSGAMLSVSEPVTGLRERLASLSSDISIAAINSPTSMIVSGERAALSELYEDCVADHVWTRWVPVDYAAHSSQVEQVREALIAELAPVVATSSAIRFQSSVTGHRLDTAELDAGYWYANLRQPVLFQDAVQDLLADGYRAFIEVSPHTVLTAPILQIAEATGDDLGELVVLGSLKREHGRRADFLDAVGHAWSSGVRLDWKTAFSDRPGRRVALPRYAFSRQRFWVQPAPGTGDLREAGLLPARHPVLAARVRLAGGLGELFTGRFSRQQQPWLAEHTVFGDPVVPATALLELAASAGAQLGLDVVDELTLQSPLLVPADGVSIQLQVREPEPDGTAEFSLHAEDGTGGWVQNGSGRLSAATDRSGQDGAAGSDPIAVARPAGAGTAIDPAALYDTMADRGIDYGESFRGLLAAWRDGNDIYAEVQLPAGGSSGGQPTGPDADYLLHPALLDAAFHAAFADRLDPGNADNAGNTDSALLPFAWAGVRLYRQHRRPGRLSVRLTSTGTDTVRMIAFDDTGALLATVDSVLARPVTAAALSGAGSAASHARQLAGRCLFGLDWRAVQAPAEPVPVAALGVLGDPVVRVNGRVLPRHDPADAGEPDEAGTPDWLVLPLTAPSGADGLRTAAAELLEFLAGWLANDRPAGARLAVLTRWAMPTRDDQPVDAELAALCGLIRSAQSEHPDRIVLIDFDDSADDPGAAGWDVDLLGAALALREPQVAVRSGRLLVPRVARRDPSPAQPLCQAEQTVLITGGLSGLGALLAEHLVRNHGARRLLLASRRGADAPGAAQLLDRLREHGARVDAVACDLSDRSAVTGLLAGVDPAHPLGAVVHSAGVLDDALITSMTAEQLDRVLRAKADSARYLHELTAGHGLNSFVLFSSVAGVLGGPGQGNYAAANGYLDALAQQRRQRGLPAVSIGWGLWQQPSEMTSGLSADDTARLAGGGVLPLSAEDGLALFDAALGSPRAYLLAARLDTAALRRQAAAGVIPAVLGDLVPDRVNRPADSSAALLAELAEASGADRDRRLLRLVRTEVADLLRYSGPDAVQPDRAFNELGLDSLGAVQLRNRLKAATGLAVPVVVVFDHPTPRAVAGYLANRVALAGSPPVGEEAATVEASSIGPAGYDPAEGVDELDADALVKLALRGL